MGDLDELGNLSIQHIKSKKVLLEAEQQVGGNNRKVTLQPPAALGASYVIKLPDGLPTENGTLQTTVGDAQIFEWITTTTDYTNANGDLPADDVANNNKIFVANNLSIWYGINGEWKRLNNYSEIDSGSLLGTYQTKYAEGINHELDTDQFYVGSNVYNGWYRENTESFVPANAVGVNINLASSPNFNSDTFLTNNDYYTSSNANPSMGVILLIDYSATHIPYVEWEYVGTLKTSSSMDAIFGFVDKLAPKKAIDTGAAADTEVQWGLSTSMSINNGVIARNF